MRTSEYQWYRPDFYEYNVVQSSVIPFCDSDNNMVVSFAVATGKTVIAECCFGYHVSAGDKVAYVSPYRSLCMEKFTKWEGDVHFESGGVAMHTGDKRSSHALLRGAMLTATTCESFDSRTRSLKWQSWLRELRCVVFDEAHTLGDPCRGMAVEAAMMRLTKCNPDCRLVLLSATMSNAKQVAEWVKSLNRKLTKCFSSAWKPNTIRVEQFHVNGRDETVDTVIERAVSDQGKKTIVFVHSKVLGKELTKRLRKQGVQTCFHNASVNRKKRQKIEKAFNDPTSGLDLLVSTSTLGAGVNIGVE